MLWLLISMEVIMCIELYLRLLEMKLKTDLVDRLSNEIWRT